ncbi:transcription initiation factor TFIID subunit 11 [Mortierella polycephala]|uniref:Transcription initiation factor TFIID subunit 11 n=1 Tax=Mortierella polycephala TaxID=41804 RepID=A0A9P6U3D4_9FUNG|nr:transcription initiation factor TFIID subunit 11 [Mortierella polycephala]
MDSTQSPLRPVQSDTMAAQTPLPTSAPSANTPGPKKRRNTGAMPSLPKPKKQKLPRNLDSITARNQLPNVPSSGGVNKAGQRMVKGPYKKREKKDKDGKKVNAGATGNSAPGTPGSAVGNGGKKAKSGTGKSTNASTASAASGDPSSSRSDPMASRSGSTAPHTSKDEDKDDAEGRKVGGADTNRTNENGEPGAEGKEDDEDEQEEEPEYTEYEWNQEASSRGRSKDELKALLDCFSDEQLQRYEVYRRSVLSRPTVKKARTILNQQVTQTMAFVVAGFCKVFVGEMVEKAREVMNDWGETGAIRPEHLREAQRRYKLEELQRGRGVQTPYGYKRRMFCK